MPRLFTGVTVPDDVGESLANLRGGISGARWTDAESYHITLRFIGDIDGSTARELADALVDVRFPSFELQLKGINVFGGHNPHTLYAGIAESAELKRLNGVHERLVQVLGLPPEHRKFSPHVTLARLREPDPLSLQRYLASENLFRSRPFQVSHFVLFSSRPSRGGGPYAVEEAYELEGTL